MPKKYKKKLDYSFIQGVYPTIELLTYRPQVVQQVFVHPKSDSNTGIQKIRKLGKEKRIRVEQNEQIFNNLRAPDNTYAIAFFDKYSDTLDASSDHVLLMQPEDMGNLGTTMRTMVGFGYRDLAIIRPAVDVFHPKAVRASMGSLFQLNTHYFESFREYVEAYPEHHNYFYTLEKAQSIGEITTEKPATFVFGSEGGGIPQIYLENGTPVTIPFENKTIDSLNLSVAIGIALYQQYNQS